MKNLKGLTTLCITLVMASSFAQSRNSRFLVDLAYDTADQIAQSSYQLTGDQHREIRIKLSEINGILSGRPVPAPQPSVVYKVLCQADDDPSFDFNQKDTGVVTGSLREVIRECEDRAIAVYGSRASAGFKNLALVNFPRNMGTYECWIDDDLSFDVGQVHIGKIAANGVKEASAQCNDIAEFIYDGKGSAGLDF